MRLARWPFMLALPVLALALPALAPAAEGPDPQAGLPDPALDTRPLWSPTAGGFIRDWLLLGPLPNPPRDPAERTTRHPVGAGFDVDYLGGEDAVRPRAGDPVTPPVGPKVTWTRYESPADVLDFKAAFDDAPEAHAVAYAYTLLTSPKAGRAYLALGSDDSVKVWLNGSPAHEHVVGRGVEKDQDLTPIRLAKGPNALLIKVENVKGGWGLVARVLSPARAAALDLDDLRPEAAPDPADPTVLEVTTDASAAIHAAAPKVRVEAIAPGGKVLAETEAARGETVRLAMKDWPDGPFEVRVTMPDPLGRPVRAYAPAYKGDWRRQGAALREAAARVAADATDPRELRLRVVAEILDDRLGDTDLAKAGPQGWRPVHAALMEHREIVDSSAVRPGGFVRLAWVDPVDGSAQFARAYLPPDYEPGRACPLVVVLHGYNPRNPPYVGWWSVDKRHHHLSEAWPVVILEPHGRGNTGYAGIGELDVLRAMAEARQVLEIDAERTYLMGHSMGGAGTWALGRQHPGVFAAIGPIFGGWDYHVYTDPEEYARLTPRDRFAREARSTFAGAEALRTTPVFVNHGDADALVEIEHSRFAVRMLQRWGYDVRYWEHPGKGHGGLGCEDTLVEWFLRHRLNRAPKEVRIRAADLKHAAAHWVRVLQRDNPFAFIHVLARVIDPRTVRLATENVLAVRVDPPAALVEKGAPVRVLWNGRDAGDLRAGAGGLELRAPGYAPGVRPKTPDRAGPFEDVYRTPWALVVGSVSGDRRMDAFCRRRAEVLKNGWRTWQHVEPRTFLDTVITDEQMNTYSLVLVGGPKENRVARRMAGALGLSVEPGAVTLAGRRFEAPDTGFQVVRPHPNAADRYVAVIGGTSAEGMFFTDRIPDDLDFALADDRRLPAEGDPTGVLVASGRFGTDWGVDERFVLPGDAKARDEASRRRAPPYLSTAVPVKRLPLSDVLESSAAGSFVTMRRGANWQGEPLRVGGKTYKDGLGVTVWDEPCTATWRLHGGWKKLKGVLGLETEDPDELDEKAKASTRIFFVVRGDGEERFRSEALTGDSKPVPLDLDVTGVAELELEVGSETRRHGAARSVNWADLRLER